MSRSNFPQKHNSLGYKVLQCPFDDGAIIKGNFYKDLLSGFVIHTCTCFFAKKCLEETGYFDENLAVCEDYDLWLRITEKYPALYFNKITAKYRIRDEGLSGKSEDRKFLYRKWQEKILKKHFADCEYKNKDFIARRMADDYKVSAWECFNSYEFKKAREMAFLSLIYNKIQFKVYAYILISFLKKIKTNLCLK